jgi:hypothetical protein
METSDKPKVQVKTCWVGGPPDLFQATTIITPEEVARQKQRDAQKRHRQRLKERRAK